jgi:hypothetical protein
MTITTAPALASIEDTPSVAFVLRSPDVLVRKTLAGLVTVAARCRAPTGAPLIAILGSALEEGAALYAGRNASARRQSASQLVAEFPPAR